MKEYKMQIHTIQNTDIVYKIRKPGNIIALLAVMFLSGLYFAYLFASPVSIVLSILAVFFYITDNGTILDLEHKQFTSARIFRGKAKAKWEDLPSITYVSVFKTTMVSTTHSITYRELEMKEKVYTINLIHDKRKRMQVYQTNDKNEGLNLAMHIAEKLEVPVFNATERQGNWV